MSADAAKQVDWTTLLRAHYALQRGCFISETAEIAGGVAAYSSLSSAPMWNHAAWIDGDEEAFNDFLDSAARSHSTHSRKSVLYIAEPNAQQIALAEGRGFEKFDEEVWMLGLAEGKRSSRVAEVRGVEALDDYCQIFAAAFLERDKGYQAALAARGRLRHFVLRGQGKAVAIGSIAIREGLACIYNVGTHPLERRKGYAREMVQHLVALAREKSCSTIFLQVESGNPARQLYEQLGFRTAFKRVGFRARRVSSETGGEKWLSRVIGRSGDEDIAVRETRSIPANVVDRLQRKGAAYAARVFTAAWAYLLHRYTGEDCVPFAFVAGEGMSPRLVRLPVTNNSTSEEWISGLDLTTGTSAYPASVDTLVGLDPRRKFGSFALEIRIDPAAPQTVTIEYRTAVLDKDSVQRLSAHYLMVLRGLVCGAESLQDLEILSEEERRQLLVTWNSSDFRSGAELLVKLFEEQVERSPEASALVLAGGEHSVTYRQLNRRANRLAHRLLKLGAGPERSVAVVLERSIESVVACLAIWKAGGVYVPLDLSSPPARLAFILQDSEAEIIISERRRLGDLPLGRGVSVLCADDPSDPDTPEKNPITNAGPQNVAYIIYTSGSTGQPKGVTVTQHALTNHCRDCCREYGLSARDKVLQFSSFNFDASLEQLWPSLLVGATVVLRGEEIWSAPEFLERVHEHGVTVADLPTPYWHDLVTYCSSKPEELGRSCLRLMIVGGEAMSPEQIALWHEIAQDRPRLINAYGPTEAVITATSCELDRSVYSSRSASIGRPRGDRKVYVLDRLLRPVPIGVPGELHIGGSMLARGYHRNPQLTAERFLPNPFSDDPEARLYKTGDLVRYLPDGNLEFLGRADNQVKLRGYRIEPGEIEASLKKHPAVREAIVIARDDVSGEKRLAAYVRKNHRETSASELHSHLSNLLPDYMIPSTIEALDEWPLLPSGKIDREALSERAASTRPTQTVAVPRDALELQVQLLFERILKRIPIGINESFFELGGDSLQALELLVQIERETGKRLPLELLYQAASVEKIADELRKTSSPEDWSSLVPLQTGGRRPPLFLLHTTPGDVLGYGNLVYRLGSDQPCYGLQSLGLKDATLSQTSIEAMAQYYVGLVRTVQPEGPYYLAGWCYGGIVAFEMARILKAQNAEIGLLALLETVAMPATYDNYRYYLHRVRRLLRMSPRRWVRYAREKVRYNRTSRMAARMRFRQAGSSGAEQHARLAQLEHVYRLNLEALRRYRSRPYDGTVTLFNAVEKDPALIRDPEYGWAGLARRIEIYEVPGKHDTMLMEPNVSVLARELNDCLQKTLRS